MTYIAQHVLQGKTGLPEDRYINTFAFKHDGEGIPPDIETAADLILARLQAFYTTNVTTPQGPQSIASFYPDMFTVPAGGSTVEAIVKVYDLNDTQPRQPFERPYAFVGPSSGAPLPAEVALVASFYGGKNIARQRGRVFLGPFKTTAQVAGANGLSRPAPALINTVAGACQRMAGVGDGLHWSVLSRAQVGVNQLTTITQGWVDDAWDTQRRRGAAETMRTTWTANNL